MTVLLSTSIDKSDEDRYNTIYNAIQAIARSHAACSEPTNSVFLFDLSEMTFNILQRKILSIYENVDYFPRDTFLLFVPSAPEGQEFYALEYANENKQRSLTWKSYYIDDYIKLTKKASKQQKRKV